MEQELQRIKEEALSAIKSASDEQALQDVRVKYLGKKGAPIQEPQTIALKATRSKEALPSKVAQVEAVGLNDEEMALIIKRFKKALKGHKEHPNKNKTKGKRSCFKCGKIGHFIANCPDNDSDQEKGNKRETLTGLDDNIRFGQCRGKQTFLDVSPISVVPIRGTHIVEVSFGYLLFEMCIRDRCSPFTLAGYQSFSIALMCSI